MKTNWMFLFGAILLIDGLMSLYFGHKCLNSCMNNSLWGDAVRVTRAGIGAVLVYWGGT